MRRLGAGLLVPATALTLALALAAPAAAANVPATRWAKSVCRAVGEWNATIDDALGVARVGAADAPGLRKNILKALKRVQSGTRSFLADLDDAGTPKVKNGGDAATAVRDGYETVLATVTDARKTLKSASTANAAAFGLVAQAQLETVVTAVVEVNDTFMTEPALNTSGLLKAFGKTPACKRVQAA